MAIFSLLAKLGLDGTNFETGLKRSQSMAKSVSKEMTAALAGAFAVEKLREYGKEAVETAGRLQDLSNRLGVSTDFLQEMKFAAEMGGASLEDVASAIEKIAIVRMRALAGDKAAIQMLENFNVTGSEIKALRLEDVFFKIGKQFQGAANPERLVGPLREIAGRGASALIPAMVEGLEESAQQARNLGLVMDQEVITAMDDLNDRLDILKAKAVVGMGNLIGQFITPVLKVVEAAYSAVEAFFLSSSIPEGGKEPSGPEMMRHMISQARQSFRSSLEQSDMEAQQKDEAARKRREARQRAELEPISTKETFVTVSAATGDQLARTGGFTAFQTNMDRYFGSVRTQAQDIRDIARNTQRTAEAVEE